jgi:hypothetical protein
LYWDQSIHIVAPLQLTNTSSTEEGMLQYRKPKRSRQMMMLMVDLKVPFCKGLADAYSWTLSLVVCDNLREKYYYHPKSLYGTSDYYLPFHGFAPSEILCQASIE